MEITFGGPTGGDSDSDNDDIMTKQISSSSLLKKKRSGRDKKSAALPPKEQTMTSRLLRSLRSSTRPQQPYGLGRLNANDVDIAQPWIMAVYPPRPRDPGNNAPLIVTNEDEHDTGDTAEFLTIENGNPAVECLQLVMDALIEAGVSDSRMGVHFFREWVACHERQVRHKKKKKKRQRSGSSHESLPLGALSLHNYAPGSVLTFRALAKANVGCCLGTLDLTGVHGLTDSILSNIICGGSFPRLRRLSVKNCRKITGKGVASLVNLTKLCALDVGGCFNVHTDDVISLVQNHPSTEKGRLTEIYASGLGWTDVALEEIVDAAPYLSSLGVGFSPYISGSGLILTLSKLASTLTHLAVPFCDGMDDAAAAALGKKLSNLAVLDIRGCGQVNSLSGIMDGRAADATDGHLFVLARYSGISNTSLEDTKRSYGDGGLTCILDGGGIGEAIRR